MECTVCGNVKPTLFTSKNECDIYRCPACGLLFVWPISENVFSLYSQDYFNGASRGFGYANYEEDKKPLLSVWLKYLDFVAEVAPQVGSLLDVGAATGSFMQIARERGWHTRGVDVSDFAAGQGRAAGLDIITGTLESSLLEGELFDVVTMWDVVEHFPDPRKSFEHVNRLLKKGGIVALNTADAGSVPARILGRKWHLICPPEHLYYFDQCNLSWLLQQTGFEILRQGRLGKKFTLRYVVSFLENIFGMPKFFSNRIIKDTFLNRISISINTHDNMFVLARKL